MAGQTESGSAPSVMQPEWTPKVDNPPKKKSKKSKSGKSVAKRGPTALPADRGTGFEPYFADPPMTPAEAKEEKTEIYADDLSFAERIQSCIQRFRSGRRLQGNQTRYFDEYLFLGGIDTNPTPFSGNDPKDLKQMADTERHDASAALLGGDEVRFYNGDREKWPVDFSGIAAGFFSSMSPITGNDPTEVNMAIAVVENFLKYVLHHEVCPEYTDDVKQALQICSAAKDEIPMLLRFSSSLPGYFNPAAARVFNRNEEGDWSTLPGSDAAARESEQMRDNPVITFTVACSLMDDSRLFANLCPPQDLKATNQKDVTIEVSQIFSPSPFQHQQELKCQLPGYAEYLDHNRVGVIKVVPASIEDEWAEAGRLTRFNGSLYFEESIIKNLKVGMKMTVTIFQVAGYWFIKTLKNVVPTYYTFLPQQMMRHFKVPGPSPKPAPSTHTFINDGNQEEEAMDC